MPIRLRDAACRAVEGRPLPLSSYCSCLSVPSRPRPRPLLCLSRPLRLAGPGPSARAGRPDGSVALKRGAANGPDGLGRVAARNLKILTAEAAGAVWRPALVQAGAGVPSRRKRLGTNDSDPGPESGRLAGSGGAAARGRPMTQIPAGARPSGPGRRRLASAVEVSWNYQYRSRNADPCSL